MVITDLQMLGLMLFTYFIGWHLGKRNSKTACRPNYDLLRKCYPIIKNLTTVTSITETEPEKQVSISINDTNSLYALEHELKLELLKEEDKP